MENDIFVGLKSGQDLKNRATHLHQEFPGVPPPPVVTKTHDMKASIPKRIWEVGLRRHLKHFWPAKVDVLLDVASLSICKPEQKKCVPLEK